MSMSNALVLAPIGMIVWMGALYAVQQRWRDAGVVDVGWAAGVGFCVLFYAVACEGPMLRKGWVAGLLLFWSARLAIYIFFKRVWHREEDGRYQALRSYWGRRAGVNFFFFFEAQAFLAVLFSLPVLIAMLNPGRGWSVWDMGGVVVWMAAIIGESVADRQLERHRTNPNNRGVTCRAGLWRYSRHPNYFFEWLHWWAYVLLAVGSPYFWITFLGPAAMLLFVLKLTGIPHTERQAQSTRPDYRAYQRTTNTFFPWFPRKEPC